jgi:FkbM family methyltransferase
MNHFAALLPRRIKPWLWVKLSSLMHLDYHLPSGIRTSIRSYSDWCIYNDIFVAGEYDVAIYSALDKAASTGTFRVVDLGANVGFFSLRIMDLIRRRKIPFSQIEILLVEASPNLDRELRERMAKVSQNGLTIKIVHGLVGEKKGQGQLQIATAEIKNSVVHHSSSHTLPVNYVDLDVLLGTEGRIDLLKCDIEGSEVAFLKNYILLLKRTEVAVFEFHQPACPFESGLAKMMEAGFSRHDVLLDQGLMQTVLFRR